MASETDTGCITPEENQYFELRAVNVKEVTGQNKQVTMELWGNNLEFKGFDVRFTYDNTKIETSNLLTNEITNDTTKYFEFADEFKNALEFETIQYDATGTGIRARLAFKSTINEIEETEHIINKDVIGKVINTGESVLLGKMSFQMKADVFDSEWFQLVENSDSYPTTGIKINLNGFKTDTPQNFQAQSTFKFTDKTASKDASLSNIVVSSGEKNDTEPEKHTYKEYQLKPEFDPTKLEYEITLLEYIDDLDIKITPTDSKAKAKIKVPKRDDHSNLQYKEDGTTIIYEEKEILADTPLNVIINKLGEPDTKLTITVTAEDGKTTKDYILTIKRPYGTIKGQVQLGETLRATGESYGIFLEYLADIKVYEAGKFIWSDLITAATDYSVLDAMKLETSTQSDANTGEFTIYVIPGQYDVFIEKLGFTQAVSINKIVNAGDNIDLGLYILYEGDVNRDGILDVQDLTTVKNVMLMDSTNPWYESQCDFLGKGYVDVIDLTATKNSLFKSRTIEIR